MWVRFPPSPPSAEEQKKPVRTGFFVITSIIAQHSKPIPTRRKRNELIVELRDAGSTLYEIANHPKIIELSDHKILTLSRVAQIYRKTKRG